MFEETLIPLQLIKDLKLLKGKTRLQKLVFLIQKEATKRNVQTSSFSYEIYRYGPFSFELASALENLVTEQFIEERIQTTPNGYTKYVYELTTKGERLLEDAKKKNLISSEIETIIRNTANEFGEVQLSDVVSEAYRKYAE